MISLAAIGLLLPQNDTKAASTLLIGYGLDEGSGNVASDVSGFNRHGTLVNAAGWSPGRFGAGLMLNGTSQYLRANNPNLPTGDFTWAFWVNAHRTQGFQTLMEAQGTTAAELELNLVNGALNVWSSGSQRLTTTSLLTVGSWTHVALTRAGNVLRVYVNGAADPRVGGDSRPFNFASCPLLVGIDADSGCTGALNGYFDGVIDEVQIHASALTATEIQQIMNTPLGGGGGADTTPPFRSSTQTSITVPAGTSQATIQLTTGEASTCRYGTVAGVAYASLPTVFSSTGGTTHSTTVSGLTDGSTRTHYIRCMDQAGNSNPDDFLIAVTVSSSSPPPSTTAFYVAPSGSDQNPGTLQQPFQTIDRARVAVRSINGSMSANITVFLRGGEHMLPSSLLFDQLDSGSNGFDVVYAAYPGEHPVLHGGQHITGWASVGGGIYKANVGQLRFRQLYVNGKRAVRARRPDAGNYFQVRSWDTSGRRVEVSSGEIGNWQRLNQAEMVILGTGVNQSNLRLSSFSVSGSGAHVTPREPERTRLFQQAYPPKNPFRPYYFENALELLDSPGEWYLNTDSSEVYYMPRPGEDLSTADVVAPRLETLLTLRGTLPSPVHNIQFRNLTFAYSTWLVPSNEGFVGDQASIVFTGPLPDDEITSYPGHRHPAAVHVEAAANLTFERNVFTHLGSSGLNLYVGTHDNRIVGNVFTDISASGISVDLNLEGNPADPRKTSRRDVVANNYLSQTGSDYFQSVGIMVGYADSIAIEHNELSDMPYSGISVGWGWASADNAATSNTIRHNRIQRVLQKMSDGGGIYTLSKQPGTLIAENYVHDIVRTSVQGGFNISGIYLDEGSSFITVRDNVLANTGDRRVFQNGNGGGVTLSNNDGQSQATMDLAGLEPAYADIRPGSPPPPQDTTPPVRSNGQPGAPLPAGTTQASVSLNTSEGAVCRYGTTAGVPFGSIPNILSSTDGTSHSTTASNLSDGTSRTYYIRCQDAAGNANVDDFAITVAVTTASPPADNVAPVVQIDSPSPGATVSGTIVVAAQASDNVGVARVEFLVDSNLLGTDATQPYSISLDTTSLANGAHSIAAHALDAAGNRGTSSPVTVTVSNGEAPPAGLVDAFAFSEGSGVQTHDSSTNANVGALMNGVAWTSQGKFNNALQLDGANDHVQVPSPDLPTRDFTWQAWVRGSQWRTFQTVMMARDGVGPELNINSAGRVVVYSSGALRFTSAARIPTAAWTHIALTRTGSALRLYVNGIQDSAGGSDGAVYNFSTCPLLIGVDSDAGCTGALNGYFTGTIDEVRVFNRALSVAEVQQEMSRP